MFDTLRLSIAKSAEADELLFVASGAYQDADAEHVGRDFLAKLADNINSGETVMLVDWWHVGFPSRSNESPSESPVILGGVIGAAFENDHLALRAYIPDPVAREAIAKNADDMGLSIWFNGATRNSERVFVGVPGPLASVAVMPRGFESYPYTAVVA